MRSMTGFGRSETVLGATQYCLEVKSVNHRFLDLRFRLPPFLGTLESALGEEVRAFCERGSLEINLKLKSAAHKTSSPNPVRFVLDEKALTSFLIAVQSLEGQTHKKMDWGLSDVLNAGKILVPLETDEEKIPSLEEFVAFFREALKGLVTMREQEGASLQKILRRSADEMFQDLSQIKALASQQPLKIKERLETRLAQWKLSEPIEPRRLEWEIAILAEKSDITEEIDRIEGHLKVFLETLNASGSVGRKLDFLTQELNREVNTIASKTTLLEITQLTVKLKSQIEKLREQVQNVE